MALTLRSGPAEGHHDFVTPENILPADFKVLDSEAGRSCKAPPKSASPVSNKLEILTERLVMNHSLILMESLITLTGFSSVISCR